MGWVLTGANADVDPGRWAHVPLVGRHIQTAFFRKVEDVAVLALAFCHAHEITLKDMATYGVLQVRGLLVADRTVFIARKKSHCWRALVTC